MDASTSLTPQVKITGDICLADCTTTHSIPQQKKYFSKLTLTPSNVTTISGLVNLIEGSGRATIILPGGTILHLQDALYSTLSKHNLLSFKDIRWNGYHLIMIFLLYKLFLGPNQIFPIYVSLVVQFMSLFLQNNVLKWVLNVDWVFM